VVQVATSHPYKDLPAEGFWRSAVAGGAGLRGELHSPAFSLAPGLAVATAGSCFAQHIGRNLADAGLIRIDAEPAPVGLSPALARRFGYGVYSARYGNIYSPRQMADLLVEVADGTPQVIAHALGDRWVDGLRPSVEPDGLDSIDEVAAHRDVHLMCIRRALEAADVFVFTLGLTEAWEDRATGRILPVCPGVLAGVFDPDQTVPRAFRYPDVMADLARMMDLLHQFRPGMKVILTVSPVPLTATASGAHVLLANTQSKATLRAAAGDFAADRADVDYFPSYEIITSPDARGRWYAPNLREVTEAGVAQVMACFRASYGVSDGMAAVVTTSAQDAADGDDAEADSFCEDRLLDAFRP
jgi:hypothetical protein